MAETLSIEPRRKGRGKSWTVECLGIITADRYWSAPSGDACRPVYLCVAQKDEVVRGFAAHLQAGRPATLRSQHGHDEPHQVEWHTGLRWAEPQRVAGGITVATAWLPELCEFDAPRMPDRLRFLLAPGERWVEEQLAAPQVQELPAELRQAAVEGGLFAAFVSTRTAWPIVPDPLFHAVLWRGVQHQPWIVTPSGTALRPGPLWVYPNRPAGLAGVALFDAGHHEFQELLRAETRRYFEREGAGRVEELAKTTAPQVYIPGAEELGRAEHRAVGHGCGDFVELGDHRGTDLRGSVAGAGSPGNRGGDRETSRSGPGETSRVDEWIDYNGVCAHCGDEVASDGVCCAKMGDPDVSRESFPDPVYAGTVVPEEEEALGPSRVEPVQPPATAAVVPGWQPSLFD